MNKSKWKYVYNECVKKGYLSAAGWAEAIEKELTRIYGETATKAWIKADPKDVEELNLIDLVSYTAFCPGCEEADSYESETCACDLCKFGHLNQKCGTPNSLFAMFLSALRHDIHDADYLLGL